MIPYIKGKVALQAHVGIPEGLYEEEYGRNGFYGSYAHLYRKQPLVAWSRIEGALRPRAYELLKTPRSSSADYLDNRTLYLYNDDVRIYFASIDKTMNSFFRNADGDEVLFIHKGEGQIFTDFGPMNYRKGDYLVLPRGTIYQLSPKQETKILVMESMSEVHLPDKGMLGQQALFDPAMMTIPSPEAYPGKEQNEYELIIKRQGALTRVYYPFCPLNVEGWKGTLTAWQINVDQIRPISCDRFHLPPSVHTTFVAKNFIVVSFLPRPLENGDIEAVKVPFFHSNIDFDEVIFYHSGDFFSRSGITEAMITFHPQGIHHGPHKAAMERSKNAQKTDEIAVMIDTKNPLHIADGAEKVEFMDYWKSWSNYNAK